MPPVKKHLWKKEYRNFLEIAKMESVSYDVLKKAFYKLQDMKKAVKYARNTFSIKDHEKYEYNGKKYNLSHYCKILSEVTGYGISTIRGRAKNGWSLDQIISTPVYQYRDEKREEYNKNVGAKVKIYDLDDNLLYECDTYSQAAKYLNTTISNVTSACNRSGVFQGKYKLRSKASTEENRIKVRQSSKKNNALFCRISYATEELTKDVAARSKKFNRQLYYKNNCDTIKKKIREYYFSNREVKLDNNKVYYVKNRDYLQEKQREWVAKNRERWEDYHKNYRRKASDELSDVYIKTTLATTLGLSAAEITPKMIELKRKQIEIFRNLK
jgi:hypothetical protein